MRPSKRGTTVKKSRNDRPVRRIHVISLRLTEREMEAVQTQLLPDELFSECVRRLLSDALGLGSHAKT